MRRTKSLNNSQIDETYLPKSSTKSKYFGRQSISSAFRKSTVSNFGPELSRKLAQLVKIEKAYLQAMEVVANEKKESAVFLSEWGADNEEDVSDITDKLGVLLFELGELQDQFIDKHDQYRISLKTIRGIESSVQPSRDRKDRLAEQLAQLKYKNPQHKKIPLLEQELVRSEADSLVAEAQLSNITRERFKTSFNYQFDAIIELSEKFALIAGYGNALLELLDDQPTTPGEVRTRYNGYQASGQIVRDAESALHHWSSASNVIKPTLSFYQTADDVYIPRGTEEAFDADETSGSQEYEEVEDGYEEGLNGARRKDTGNLIEEEEEEDTERYEFAREGGYDQGKKKDKQNKYSKERGTKKGKKKQTYPEEESEEEFQSPTQYTDGSENDTILEKEEPNEYEEDEYTYKGQPSRKKHYKEGDVESFEEDTERRGQREKARDNIQQTGQPKIISSDKKRGKEGQRRSYDEDQENYDMSNKPSKGGLRKSKHFKEREDEYQYDNDNEECRGKGNKQNSAFSRMVEQKKPRNATEFVEDVKTVKKQVGDVEQTTTKAQTTYKGMKAAHKLGF